MKDQDKTKKQLIEELEELRRQTAELKATKDRETEEVFKTLAHSTTIGVYIVRNGKFLFTNSTFRKYVGYSEDEILGLDSLSLVFPEDRDKVREKAERMLKGEESFPYEFRYIDKNGKSLWVKEAVLPVRYRGEQAVLGNLIDITGRKQAEENYKHLLDDMSDGYVVVRDGKYVYINTRFGRMMGYEPEELVGRSAFDMALEDDRERFKDLYGKMERREHTDFKIPDVEAMRKDGTRIMVEAKAKIIEYEDGPALCAIIRDVTEHRQAEEKYKQLLENMSDGYVVVQDGKYVFANRRFYEMFRYEPGEAIKRPIMQMVASDIRHPAAGDYSSTGNGKKAFFIRHEGIAKRKDGRTFLCEAISKTIQYDRKPAFAIIIRDITKSKRAEEDLIRSERKYRELAESISDVFVAMDNKLRYTYWNKAAEIYTGIPAEDALGKHPQELFPGVKAINESMKEHLEVIRTGESRQFTGKVRLGGKGYVMEVSLYPSGDGISVFARDITKHRHMQKELRESRERFQALVESTSDWVWEVNAKGVYTYASPRVKHLLGYEPEEVIGKTPFDLMPAERAAELAGRFMAIAKSNKPFEGLENINLHKDGRLVVLETSGIPFFDASGCLCGYRGIDRDITERKRAENVLRDSEEKLRLTFESVPEGITVCDLKGQIINVNEGVLRMHGYDDKADLIGQSCYKLMSRKDCSKLEKDFTKTLEKGGAGITLYTFMTKDGKEFMSATSMAVMRDTGGQPSGFVILTTDITEQQRRQEQLMLTDRLASIGQLTSGIAHELNNPLTSVIGFSELLLEKEFPDDIREDLETIDREARRAADVVKGLLTFVRKQGTEKVPIDINGIIRDVLQLRSYEQKVNKIKVEARLAPDLHWVTGNGAQLQQVFVNLIVNAEQAMHGAHGKGSLKVITERDGEIVRITINDDGPGISPEDMKRLFTPFFTTKEVGKGTGLGLSICHGIITEHSGRIYAKSEPEAGASFVVELPESSVGGWTK